MTRQPPKRCPACGTVLKGANIFGGRFAQCDGCRESWDVTEV